MFQCNALPCTKDILRAQGRWQDPGDHIPREPAVASLPFLSQPPILEVLRSYCYILLVRTTCINQAITLKMIKNFKQMTFRMADFITRTNDCAARFVQWFNNLPHIVDFAVTIQR